MQQLQFCTVCRSEIRVSTEGGGFVAACGCGTSQVCGQRYTAYRSLRRAAIAGGTDGPVARQATGGEIVVPMPHSEDFEKRAQHIADVIAECAEFMHVQPCDLSRPDFVKYTKIACPTSHNDLARDMALLGGFEAIRATYYPPQATDRATTLFQIRKHAALNRRLGATSVADDLHFKQIEEWAGKVFAARPPAGKAPAFLKHGQGDEIERELVLLIGDPHFGADIVGIQTGGPNYGPVEEGRRFAQVASRALDWKPEHRKKTGLTIAWLGDMLQGNIHDPRSSAQMWEQTCRAMWTSTYFVELLAPEFRHVHNHCVGGNHDRDIARHPQPATSGEGDNRATPIYFEMMMATRKIANMTWDIPIAGFCTFKIFDAWYYIAHGHTGFKVSGCGGTVSSKALEAEALKFNAARRQGEQVSVFAVGHYHAYHNETTNSGAQIFINGALTPIDTYARSVAIYRGSSSQTLIEATPNHPAGDRCTADLDEAVDRDASLDALVPTFKGL
jgi:hypothetical protein